MKSIHRMILLIGLCVIASGIAGCHKQVGGVATQPEARLIFHRLAVAPFQQTTEQLDMNAADSNRFRFFTRTDGDPDRPESIMERIFIQRLKAGYDMDVIPPDRVAGVYERYTGAFDRIKPLALLKKVGDDLNADGIVFGCIYRFRERQGMPYAAVKPASVAFEIYLFRVSDGSLVWKGQFEKTQASLMEDVLQASAFVKGGGRWVTVRELSEEGMDHIMKNFPVPSK